VRQVFVSYASEDGWIARQVAREVTACGARPYIYEADDDLGAAFEQQILGFLNQADELVALLTPWSIKRPYIWSELGVAWSRGISIVVVVHGMTVRDFLKRPDVPMFLKSRTVIHINELDRYFAQLRARVEQEEHDG
jgi:hypothetical protein